MNSFQLRIRLFIKYNIMLTKIRQYIKKEKEKNIKYRNDNKISKQMSY